MLNLYYLRQAVIAAGGTGNQVSEVGLLRQLVAAYGGTPTKWEPLGLLREAITASGGTPTQTSLMRLLKELVIARGTPTDLVNVHLLQILLAGSAPPAVTFYRLTETSDRRLTEAGAVRVTE